MARSPSFDTAFQQVLRAAQTGADWAFTRLYESLAPAVVGYLRAQGADDPEGLTSDVFVKVFTASGSFAGSEAEFRSWVFTIARCRLIDARRAKTRVDDAQRLNRADLSDLHGTTTAAAEDEVMARLAAERVAQLLGELTPGQRDVLSLRLVVGMSVDEVAAVLDKPPTAVKALQRRALATLRRRLGVQTPCSISAVS